MRDRNGLYSWETLNAGWAVLASGQKVEPVPVSQLYSESSTAWWQTGSPLTMSSLIAQDGTINTILGWSLQAASLDIDGCSGSKRRKFGGHLMIVADKTVHFEDSRKYWEEIQGSLSSYLVALTGGE